MNHVFTSIDIILVYQLTETILPFFTFNISEKYAQIQQNSFLPPTSCIFRGKNLKKVSKWSVVQYFDLDLINCQRFFYFLWLHL